MVPRYGELYNSFHAADHCPQVLPWQERRLSADPYPAKNEVSGDLPRKFLVAFLSQHEAFWNSCA